MIFSLLKSFVFLDAHTCHLLQVWPDAHALDQPGAVDGCRGRGVRAPDGGSCSQHLLQDVQRYADPSNVANRWIGSSTADL